MTVAFGPPSLLEFIMPHKCKYPKGVVTISNGVEGGLIFCECHRQHPLHCKNCKAFDRLHQRCRTHHQPCRELFHVCSEFEERV